MQLNCWHVEEQEKKKQYGSKILFCFEIQNWSLWIWVFKAICNFKLNDEVYFLKTVNHQFMGKFPGLVVNVEDSQSEPLSLDVSSIPGFA